MKMDKDKELMAATQNCVNEFTQQMQDAIKDNHKEKHDDALIKWAFTSALLAAMKKGYKLTDLPWFKRSPYYTGDRLDRPDRIKKAA